MWGSTLALEKKRDVYEDSAPPILCSSSPSNDTHREPDNDLRLWTLSQSHKFQPQCMERVPGKASRVPALMWEVSCELSGQHRSQGSEGATVKGHQTEGAKQWAPPQSSWVMWRASGSLHYHDKALMGLTGGWMGLIGLDWMEANWNDCLVLWVRLRLAGHKSSLWCL